MLDLNAVLLSLVEKGVLCKTGLLGVITLLLDLYVLLLSVNMSSVSLPSLFLALLSDPANVMHIVINRAYYE